MRLNKIALVLTTLLLILLPHILFAQEDTIKLTQDYAYVTEVGTVIFSYPEDWGVAERVDLDGVSISNNLPLLEEPERGLGQGTFFATISALTTTGDASLSEILDGYYAERFGEFESTEGILGNNQVAIGEPTNDSVDVRLYAVRFGDVVVYMDVVTNPGDMASLVEAIDALVASIDFTTRQLVIETTAEPDVDETDAQIILSETFTLEDEFTGFLSVNYPESWFAQEEGGSVTVSNTDIGPSFQIDEDGALQTGEIAIAILALPADDMSTLFGIQDTNSPDAMLDEFIALLSESTSTADIQTFDMPPAELLELGPLTAAQSTGSLMLNSEVVQEFQMIAMISGDGIIFVVVVAGGDTLANYQEAVYDIVQSIEYRTP